MFLWQEPKEKLYVWFDAPIGYISAKEWQREGKEWVTLEDQDTKLFTL
jgi:methionyl-tRNA synthetase